MPSREQLETALRNADAAGDTGAAAQLATALREGALESFDPAGEIGAQPSEGLSLEDIDKAFLSIPGVRPLAELAAGANRTIAGMIDFIGPDTINAALQMAGIEKRMTTATELTSPAATFMEPGLGQEIMSSVGEVLPAALGAGAYLRSLSSKLPAFAPGETAGTGVIRQLGTQTGAQDVTLGALSGAGAALGEEVAGETGELVGSILAPMTGALAKTAMTKLVNIGKQGIEQLMRSTSGMSEEGASTLLAESMVREGLSPEEVTRKIAELGPEAIPADVGINFSRLLRTASNKIPRIEGQASEVFAARHAGQGNRMLSAFDDATGTPSLSVDDEIVRLNKTIKPQVDELYAAARLKSEEVLKAPPEKPKGRISTVTGDPRRSPVTGDIISPSAKSKGRRSPVTGELVTPPVTDKTIRSTIADKPSRSPVTGKQPTLTKLERLLAGENITGKAKKAADIELNAKRLSGEPVTSLDVIDANKRALDDLIIANIRKGETNKSRSFVKLKNLLVNEVDALIPEYKAARSAFAGKAALEDAAESGGLFLKMKPSDMKDLTQTMGESERRFFKLGAKKAILEKLDDIQTSADAVKRLFGKNGDVKKLRYLFDDEAAFNKFNDTLRKEANFVLTRRAAQANSTTAKQLSDEMNATETLSNAAQALTSPLGTANVLGRTIRGLSSKKGTAEYTAALEEVGDILLSKGFDPDKLQSMLRQGNAKKIEEVFRKVIKENLTAPSFAPTTSIAAGAESLTEGN